MQHPISIYNTRRIFGFDQRHNVVVSTDHEEIANHYQRQKRPHSLIITSYPLTHQASTLIFKTYNTISFEDESSLKFSHTSTHLSVSTSTTFPTFPLQADQKHIVTEIKTEWVTVWGVFPELSENPVEPVANLPSSPSTIQAIISSTIQISILTNIYTTTFPQIRPAPSHQHSHFLQQLQINQKIQKIQRNQKSTSSHNSKDTCTNCHKDVPHNWHQTETSQKVSPLIPKPQSHSAVRSQHKSKVLKHHDHHKTPTTRLRDHSHTINFHQFFRHCRCHHNHRQHYPYHNTSTQTNIPILTLIQLNIPSLPRFYTSSTSTKLPLSSSITHFSHFTPHFSGSPAVGILWGSPTIRTTTTKGGHKHFALEDTPRSRNKRQTNINKRLTTQKSFKSNNNKDNVYSTFRILESIFFLPAMA